MPEPRDDSPGDDYFNDLTQQPSNLSDPQSRRASEEDTNNAATNGQAGKLKRIACVICRKRKLKCDGAKPACGTCSRLQHDCSYDEARKKSGPKRGYVKALEQRLAQVETLLKTQDDVPVQVPVSRREGSGIGAIPEDDTFEIEMLPVLLGQDNFHLRSAGAGHLDGSFEQPTELIGLGLDEPLPHQDIVDVLNNAYFTKIHPSLPVVHRSRYYAAMHLAPHMRPPIALRYAMWCNAAGVTDQYEGLQEAFYQRARKYLQQDEMKGHGEPSITVGHCQAWSLLATYEFKLMYFPRAWMSAGRACRLALMMGLHRQDGLGVDVKQCIPPPRDWTEREQRRRTFWMAFSVDRYASIGTGWPMTVDEGDIMTNLPCEEDAYDMSREPATALSLTQALEPSGPAGVSSFGGVVLMACLFGRNITHLHRPGPDDRADDLEGEFWKRHRDLENIILNISLALPEHLRLPQGLNNANTVFLNMNLHTSTICLHQAAIFKADKNRMSARVSAESKVRCITAAAETASIMRQICHLDLSAMNPFICFSLYVAARVFVQYLKSRPKDSQVQSSLQFLLSAMHAIKRKNPLTNSFLVQLDVDMEGAGLEPSLRATTQTLRTQLPAFIDGCNAQHLVAPQLGNKDGTKWTGRPTYGDTGLAAYSKPDLTGQWPSTTPASESHSTGFVLPVRTPGGTSLPADMDTSPDNSGDQGTTPGSSTQSQRNGVSSGTSHTGYSPVNMQTQDNGPTNMFGPNTASFTTGYIQQDFSISDLQQQQSGFVLPQSWNGSSGMSNGSTQGGVGAAAESILMTGGFGDLVNGMSEADWDNVLLDSFGASWESGVEPAANFM
ncbi:unnamed protein product [Zymoseptoria tritici ST99CH_1E4]|uniref:Zn(2)-C6 fungal-type domain-containing protein n=1 Tax=Zymoseptoria tritici ST99CH_1E4 TaxID=1276532 RepID=A0A2H1FMD5_ZYMTR|nr:unnamed protein product [Zymoseptoria tritici ST99CH_1E4]